MSPRTAKWYGLIFKNAKKRDRFLDNGRITERQKKPKIIGLCRFTNRAWLFFADPTGLTADSLIRRTTNMLSLALRYGTPRHIEPRPQQIEGDKKNGVEPLEWRGDDIAKTRAWIHTFVTTFENKAPEFKDVRYDFNRREFIGRLGVPVDRATFQRRASEGMGRATRAGEATARRGILIKSLISSESFERLGILEHVLNRARAFVSQGSLSRSFSRQATEATFQGGFVVSGL